MNPDRLMPWVAMFVCLVLLPLFVEYAIWAWQL